VSGEASAPEAYLYVISCRLELAKIGVAGDARKRLRELQVGSPVELKLTLSRPYAERRDADAVAQELFRCFAGRRVRGSWYRLTLEEIRHALARPATLEAPARAAAEAAARERQIAPRRSARLRGRTEKQLAYERRRRQERAARQKRAAKLLDQGMSQQQAAAVVGVTTRTLRNWKTALAFRRQRERQHKRAARQQAPPSSKAKPPARQDAEDTRRDRAREPRPAAQPQPERPPAPPARQQTTAAAGEQPPSGFRRVDGVPLWGDSDGWPRTPEEHAERDAHYTARRDLSEDDRYDYYTVVHLGRQTAAERRAVSQEKKRSRELARAKRTPSRDP
jgi:hypothetical protein